MQKCHGNDPMSRENFEGERHSFQGTGFDELAKSRKVFFPSFRRKPESGFFEHLQNRWTPVTLSRRKPGTGVTTSSEAANSEY